jgi:hypothetical protein
MIIFPRIDVIEVTKYALKVLNAEKDLRERF